MLHAWIEWPLLAISIAAFYSGELEYVPRVLTFFRIEDPSLRSAAVKCVYWICAAIVFNGLVWLLSQSSDTAEAWTSGYVLEYTLSIDNLFIFQMLFRFYETPANQIDKALLFGIAAAAILRLVFFIIGTSLFEWITWVRLPFGILLLLTAYKTVHAATHATTPVQSETKFKLIELAERHLPFIAMYDLNGKFFLHKDSADWVIAGRLISPPMSPPLEEETTARAMSIRGMRMTMLGAVVFALALVDVIFALDAVAAKVAQTHDLFVNFTSSLFAMASFRSLYFVVAQLTLAFRLLKYGVALILAYVGIELMISVWYTIPNSTSCLIILSICGGSVVASLFQSMLEKYQLIPPSKETAIELPESFGLKEVFDDSPIHSVA
jgi:tellurite resistance protein TerC